MSNFVFVYHATNMPQNPEDGAKEMEKWNAWVKDLGDAMINPGTPMGNSQMVSSTGVNEAGGPAPIMGFSIIKADNMDAALEIAKSCPFLVFGTVQVAQEMKM